jgi:CheY-like chemotaxis protein
MAQTVMVVEDHAATREGMAAIVRRNGYDVVAAGDGQEALDRLAAGPLPEVVLLDMLLPVLDGWRLLERLTGTPYGTVPVIITTGADLSPAWAAAHGCAGFLQKPVDEPDLLAELDRVIGPA